MKENLENKIKQSLENHEMSYNASAWTAMQAKLDVVKPVTSPTSNLKWYISAASVVAVSIISYVALNSSTETVNETPKQADQAEVVENKTTLRVNRNTENNNTTLTTTASNTNDVTVENSNSNQRANSIVSNSVEHNPFVMTNNGNGIGNDNGNSGTNPSNGNGNSTSGTTSSQNTIKNYVLPKVADVCEGETTTIKNTNDVSLIIEGPDMHFIIPANSERKVRMNKEGAHEISVQDQQNLKKASTFFVKRAPTADFTIDTDTKFEKGLPTTKLETSVPGVEHSWVIGKSRVYGEKIDAHFYKSGNHDVTLTVKDLNGCSNSITKSIRIDEKYNLMAVNSFIPEDIDSRNNTFMPFALTQRNVKFNLIIIDLTDGHTVFQSNDASNAWNGIDKTTGNGVNYGTTYIWKVTIENAEPNENNEYAGNIMPIQKR